MIETMRLTGTELEVREAIKILKSWGCTFDWNGLLYARRNEPDQYSAYLKDVIFPQSFKR